jgi:hypothetical protein
MVKMETDTKHHVRGYSTFQWYRNGDLYYKTSDTQFIFRVPVSDLGEADIYSSEKSIHLMKYIRKELEGLNNAVD